MPPTNIQVLKPTPEVPHVSCAAIGEGNILLSCLKILLHKSFEVRMVFSNTPQVQTYCDEVGIKFYRRSACLEDILKDNPVEYFFSISNPRVLTENILKLPQTMTINYHDSMLPAYAGVHATSWAIIQGEIKHGITWHVVEVGIDTGDILVQREVDILEEDSAFTLNVKCQDAAIDTFNILTEHIQNRTVKCNQQSALGRSYFGLYAIPANVGVLCFKREAKKVYNQARALEFGNYENALGSPKILTSTGEFLLVTNLELSSKPRIENQNPGQIFDIADDTIMVSTQDGDVMISCAHLDGSHLVGNDFTKYGLQKSAYLSNNFAVDTQMLSPVRKKEGFWRRKMAAYEPTVFFRQRMNVVASIIDVSEKIHLKSVVLPLPQIDYVNGYGTILNFLLASFVAFLGRICCTTKVCIGLLADKTGIHSDVWPLYADICPGLFSVNREDGIEDVLLRCKSDIEKHISSQTFLLDMFYRYPELRGRKNTPHHNIVIGTMTDTMSESKLGEHILHDCNMLLLFNDQGDEMHLLYNERPAQDFGHIIDVLKHFPTFIQSIRQSKPELPLSEVSMVPEDEIKMLYPDSVDTNYDQNYHGNVYETFKSKSKKVPMNIAIQTTSASYTYKDTSNAIDKLASIIVREKDLTFTGNRIIGIHLPNSAAYVMSVLAVLKADHAFLPLPLDYPPDRLAFTMRDAKVTAIITSLDQFNKNEFKGLPSCPLVSLPTKIGGTDLVLVQFPIDENDNIKSGINESQLETYVPIPKDTCYVMYTSGSTGRPKGVMVAHNSVINMAYSQIQLWDIEESDNVAQFASIGFDATISEVFTALFSGATLSVLGPKERLGQEFLKAMKKLCVSVITLPPSALNIYGPTDLPTLQKVVAAGEACTLGTAIRWVAAEGVRFFNAYGPTETTVCATCYEFKPNEKYEDVNRDLPIGKKIPGLNVYLLDDYLKPVPPDVVGEIYIGGAGLSLGYLGHASHFNPERFIKSPLSQKDVTLYKTGDHAYQDLTGNLTYVGRLDDMVKIRGQRVDLSEIEQVIIQHPKIEMAVVVAHKCKRSQELSISAFVSPSFIYASELKEYLSKVLPKYMMPSFIKRLEICDFPMTLNGKIDRKTLELDETIHEQQGNIGNSHLNETQLTIAKLWCDILKLDQSVAYSMFRQSSFSELGGNSLQLVLLQRTLEETFGFHLSFTDLGTADTIEEFEEAVKRKRDIQKVPGLDVTQKQSDLREMILNDSELGPEILSMYARRGSVQFNHFHSSIPKTNFRYPKNVLISGVTGFLGAYLLSELLEQTNAHICCMVRESTESRGLGRVVENLRKYNLWKFEYSSRIAIVISDLSKERLGIAPDIYASLSKMVDVVFMNAAKMNFNTPYEDHRNANVESTKEFIKFAMTGVQKYIFTTSSLGVFLFPPTTNNGNPEHKMCYESETMEDPTTIAGGYGQSKWASERLILQAIDHLPGGAIFRPARISGCTTNGIGPCNDLFGSTMIGMKRLGTYPDMDYPYDLTPVDYVARASVEIAIKVCNDKTVTERVFHMFNKYTMPFNELFKGMNLKPLSLNEWRESLKNASEDNKELIPLTPFFLSDFWDRAVNWPIFDTSNTDKLISDETKRLLVPSEQLLQLYKSYFGV